MHRGATAARAQIFREFSGAENWPESPLQKSAVVHQSRAELWECFPERLPISSWDEFPTQHNLSASFSGLNGLHARLNIWQLHRNADR
jgi:hypothetical protein